MDEAGPSSSFLDSIRRLGDSLYSSVQDRFELLCLELQEEKCRIIRTLILVNAAIFVAFLAVIFFSLTIVYLFWESARLAVFCSLTGIYILVFVYVFVALKRYLAKTPEPFEATRREMVQDRACIRPKN